MNSLVMQQFIYTNLCNMQYAKSPPDPAHPNYGNNIKRNQIIWLVKTAQPHNINICTGKYPGPVTSG